MLTMPGNPFLNTSNLEPVFWSRCPRTPPGAEVTEQYTLGYCFTPVSIGDGYYARNDCVVQIRIHFGPGLLT